MEAGEFLLNNYPHVVGLHLDEEGSIETEVSLGEILNAFHKAKSEEQTAKIDQLIEDYQRRQRTAQKMLEKTSNDEKRKERLLAKSGVYRHVISELIKLKG